MTEELWLTTADPRPMIRFLIGTDEPRVQDVEAFPNQKGSDRKLRLFACACYHRIRHLLPHPVARAAVEVAERFADGTASVADCRRAEAEVRERSDALEGRWRASRGAERAELQPTHAALALALQALWDAAPKAAYYAPSTASFYLAHITNPGAGADDRAVHRSSTAEERAQCGQIRDIFGNPFRPVTHNQAWRTSSVIALADQMDKSRDFSAMPILADALQDAGCDSADILDHCHGPGPHVRGCWVVDLLLGK